MKNITSEKLISILLIVALLASSSSCSSKKKEYETVKEDDTWYECDSFEISYLYSDEDYDYVSYSTVGAMNGIVYVSTNAERKTAGNIRDLTDAEIMANYEQSVLKFSFEGEYLGKTDYSSVNEDGTYTFLQKAWVTDDTLNTLEVTLDLETAAVLNYIYNGEELTLPEVNNYYNDQVYITDMYTSDGYTVYILHINSWNETIAVVRPDGSFYEMYSQELSVNGGSVEGVMNLIPGTHGTVIIPVYLSNYDIVYASLDIASGEVKELTGLYGNTSMWIERASGKYVGRDYNGFSFVDDMTGDLTPICSYSDINAPLTEVADSALLYISDNGDDILLGSETYDSVGYTTSKFGYRIMHLSLAGKNPNAGKTILTLSSEQEFYPSESDLNAVHLFNEQNSSFFIKYVFPFDETGKGIDVDCDILLVEDPAADVSDANRYIDLAPLLGLDDAAWKEQYFSNAIDAARTGDSLYRVPLNISASGIITSSGNMSDGQKGFTFDQYVNFVDEVCNGVDPMSSTVGFNMGKTACFTKLFLNMSDMFISDGHVDLKGDEIRELMLFVDEYGNNGVSDDNITGHSGTAAEVISAIEGHNARLEGSYGAIYGYLYSFDEYIDCYEEIGEGIGIYGLPSFDGRGPQTVSHEFACVPSDTEYPEACAEFVKLLLSFDVQKTMTDSNPVNRDAMRYIADSKLKAYNDAVTGSAGFTSRSVMPEDTVDKYIDILSSSYGGANVGSAVEEILREESSAYFSGGRALDDVIPVMEKRIQTVLDENK